MINNLTYELGQQFLDECRDHLATLEADFLVMERRGAAVDEERVSRAFRAVHSVKGAADTLSLWKIRELAHQLEEAVALIRSHKMVPTQDRIGVLLRATDRLNTLIRNPDLSNQADTDDIMAALGDLPKERSGDSLRPAHTLKALVVEDDFASRLLLQTFLSRYSECHVAVNGREAVEAVRIALDRGDRYDLVCMDIMMPEMNGREAVHRIRAMEEAKGILLNYGSKIIMTTAVDDLKEVFQCFKELCDAYLVKPIDLSKLLGHMKSYQLIQ